MAEHKHGEMDVTVQQKTFHGFVKAVTYFVAVSIGILIFLAVVNG